MQGTPKAGEAEGQYAGGVLVIGIILHDFGIYSGLADFQIADVPFNGAQERMPTEIEGSLRQQESYVRDALHDRRNISRQTENAINEARQRDGGHTVQNLNVKLGAERKRSTKPAMAVRMKIGRSALDRLLDPKNTSVTLQTLQRAAAAVGKRLRVSLV